MRKFFLAAFFSCGALCSLMSAAVQAAPNDTVVATTNGTRFIRHQVLAKETIYSVARQYGVAITKIKQANPGLKTLLVGQIILVPVQATAVNKPKTTNLALAKTPIKNEIKKIPASTKPSGPALYDEQGNRVHQVESKQTLFSIARLYGVSLADLKKWNNLPGDNVHDNQTLIVTLLPQSPKLAAGTTLKPVDPIKSKSTAVMSAPIVISRPVTIHPDNIALRPNDTVRNAAPRETFSRVTESGLAELISEGKSGHKYLALHKTVPVGSFITVRNQMNNQSVSVRVIGKLPDIGSNEKVIVKVSKRAFQRLGALDSRFLVEVQYEVTDKILSSNQ